MGRWPIACCTFLVVAAAAERALAQPDAPPDADVTARIAWIERVLDREQASTRLWCDAWTGFFAGATLLQVGIVPNTTDKTLRVSSIAGGAKSGIAFGFLLLSPATGRTVADDLRSLRADSRAARLAKLRRAESLLRTIADEERQRRSWFPLIGGALVNLGGALIVWSTTHDAVAGWLGLASGVAVTQVHVFTQPTGAIRAWDVYTRTGSGDPGRLDRTPLPRLSVLPTGNGLLIQGSF